MREVPEQAARFPPGLQEFLAEPMAGQPWPETAAAAAMVGRELYVEEPVLGQPASRFVREGGVRLSRVTHYALTTGDLPAMFRRRPDLSRVRLVLVKFWLMFDELPPNREYAAIRIRISLQPPAPVLLLRPDGPAGLAEPAEPARAAGGGSAADLAGLVQRAAPRGRGAAAQPGATAVDLGADGFGWTYRARGGAPLAARREIALAGLEVPSHAAELVGLLDAEAQIERRLLGTARRMRAAPVNSAAPFVVSMEQR
jgi:hypothetical protein